jgi:transcriptional regulator with XRE-family HTH domain
MPEPDPPETRVRYVRHAVRRLRDRRGWSQLQLAEASRLTLKLVMAIESGDEPDPRMYALLKLAAVLGVTIDKLVEDDE